MAEAPELPQTYEWELSKENVQPLKQGRQFASLTAALQPHSDQLSKLKEERQWYETQLRTYSGDDPLDIWDKYIKWTEQNFPKGGKDSNLVALLERCASHFKEDERYTNDPRYLDTWIKFAKFCNDPLDIFNFLYNQGIGTGLSLLYESWTWELERLDSYKRADVIYKKGIEAGAQPLDNLRKKHSDFQVRIAQKVAGGNMPMADTHHDGPDAENQRTTLGVLKGQGKKALAPANRVSAAKPGGGLGSSAKPRTGNSAGQNFQLYCDENSQRQGSLAPPTGAWQGLPSAMEANRENEQLPGKWNKSKVPQKSVGVVPVSQVSSHSKPSFTVHTDADIAQPMITPKKIMPEANQILSARKPGRDTDPFQHMQRASVTEDGQLVPMYCKSKIYTGVAEFSFEELHAARWQAAHQRKLQEEVLEAQRAQLAAHQAALEQQKQAMEAERQRLEAERQQFLAAQQQLLAEKERCAQLQNSNNSLSQIGSGTSAHSYSLSSVGSDRASFPQINNFHPGVSSSGRTAPPQPTINMLPDTSRTGFGQDSLHRVGSASNMSKCGSGADSIHQSHNNTSMRTPNMSCTTESSGGHSHPRSSINPTPDTSSLNPFRGSGKNTPSRGSLTAPSPTVNTKEALHLVMGMFNQTLNVEKDFGWHGNHHHSNREDDEEDLEAEFAASDGKSCMGGFLPSFRTPAFTIHDETAEKKPTGVNTDPDQENRAHVSCQSGLKRPVLGVLQPAVDVPVAPSHVDQENLGPSDFGCTEILAMPLPPEDDEEMEGIQVQDFVGDFTFAPSYSSTCNFAEAARLASTPFNPLGNMAPLNAPNVSTIQTVATVPAPASPPAAMDTDPAPELPQGGTTAEESFESTVHDPRPAPLTPLSPIMERSDEDQKSTHSSGINSTASTTGNSTHHHTMGNSTRHHQSHTQSHLVAPSNISSGSAPVTHTSPQQPAKFVFPVPVAPPASKPTETFAHPQEPATTKKSRSSLNASLANVTLADQTCHEIDVTNYTPGENVKEQLSMSIALDPYDPFDEELLQEFLSKLPVPLESHHCYHAVPGCVPKMQKGATVQLGEALYEIQGLLGEGAFAQVFRANSIDAENSLDSEDKVIKLQKPACQWEFYITTELLSRLGKLQCSTDIRPSIMLVDEAYFFDDGSCLVNELHKNGTLLDLVNLHKKCKAQLPIGLTVYLTIEMLTIIEQLQACDIIHGDIKPDNFLFRSFPPIDTNSDPMGIFEGKSHALKLIDWGRSIDMRMFPPATTFTTKVTTSGFQCIEMKTDRPWTYQTDLFGIAGTIHVLLFGEYMKVSVKNKSKWNIHQTIRRYWAHGVQFIDLFESLLNIPSCSELPDISVHKRALIEYFQEHALKTYESDRKSLEMRLFC